MPALHAEAAADLAGANAQLGFWNVENAARHIGACSVRAPGPELKRETAQPIVAFADAAARLPERIISSLRRQMGERTGSVLI